jgi:hypothetical protein
MVFFFTLCLVHFTIFLYNRYELSNLLYSGLCLFVSVFILVSLSSNFTTDYGILQYYSLAGVLCPVFIFTILPYMFRAFFRMEFPKWYKGILVLGILCLIATVFTWPLFDMLLVLCMATGSVESVRIIIIAIRQKKEGVRILGLGLLMFMLLLCLILISALMGTELSTENPILGMIFLIFLVLSVCSIPLSITIFLAFRISQTNLSLANKLKEVEELSVKTIEQEKEKQHILENQKTILEEQVKERTREILAQKKVIEEKNKDIVDSILYARRIQRSLLPMEKYIEKVFRRLKE